MNEWVPGWMAKNWRTSEGKEPENIDLIKLVHYKASHRPAKVEVSPAYAPLAASDRRLSSSAGSRPIAGQKAMRLPIDTLLEEPVCQMWSETSRPTCRTC